MHGQRRRGWDRAGVSSGGAGEQPSLWKAPTASCALPRPAPRGQDSDMTDTAEKNVPRGVRTGLPKRPELDEDAWTRIRREQEKMKEREFVRFAVLKLDPAWRRLLQPDREAHKLELEVLVGEWGRTMMIYSYSLVGTRADADHASLASEPLAGAAARLLR